MTDGGDDVERAHAPDGPALPEGEDKHRTGMRERLGRPADALRRAIGRLDVGLAARSLAALHLALAVVLALAALGDPRALPMPLAFLALAAMLVGLGVASLERSGRAGLDLVYLAELSALALVAAGIAASGAGESVYHAFYLLPVAHVAVFQSRRRLLAAGALAIALLLAPLPYGPASGRFALLAVATLLPTALAVALIHIAVQALRRERLLADHREADALRVAESDPLTGVGNYRMFRRSLEKESARARRHDQPFSLIVLDLDGFKAINDELGHQTGDEALRRVAHALRDALRTEDVLCRQGGDEFGVIAVQAGHQEAGELARRLRAAVGSIRLPGLRRPLSAATGWATFAHPVRSGESLMARADRELRAAKRRRAADSRAPFDVEPEPPNARAYPADLDPRLATLSDCARALALAADEHEVAQLAVTHVIEALEASVAEMWRSHPVTGHPVLSARGRPAGPSQGRSVGAGTDPAMVEQVMRSNRVLVSPGTGEALSGVHGAGMGTDLLVPVTRGGHMLGALRVRLERPDAGSPEDRRLALALAAQVGLALSASAARAALADGRPEQAAREAGAANGLRSGERVAHLAMDSGRMLGLEAAELESLRLAALLHRLGMVGVPAGLPLRPFALSEREREVLQQHPLIAEELLVSIPSLHDAAAVLRHAYERHDGGGYPDGLAGDEIPLASRLLHAAIALVAMTSERPYRPALEPEEALAELRRAAEVGQLDPVVVEVMLGLLKSRPPAWLAPTAQRSGAAG